MENGAVKVLLGLIADDAKETEKFARRQSNKLRLLRRPIIAVCNDVYAHSLEKLRPVSEVIAFRTIPEPLIKQRLMQICAKESLALSPSSLQEIIALTNHDLRNCLNFLQFNKGLEPSISQQKDTSVSWWSTKKSVFERNVTLSKFSQCRSLSDKLNACSSIEKLISGCFSSIHEVEYQDDMMRKPLGLADWLYFYDKVSSSHHLSDEYGSEVVLKLFWDFSDPCNSTIISKNPAEFYEKRKANRHTLKLVFSGIKDRANYNLKELPLYVLPLLFYATTPNAKLVSLGAKCRRASQIMSRFGLKITQGFLETYQDPQIFQLVFFPGLSAHRLISSSQKAVHGSLLAEAQKTSAKRASEDEKGAEAKRSKNIASSIDFFKDKYNSIPKGEIQKVNDKSSTRIWIKYHEGFSDAVRKNMKWCDLWL